MENLKVDCNILEEYITFEEIRSINFMVTEPERFERETEKTHSFIRQLEEGIETGMSQDEHGFHDETGLRTLLVDILPRECRHRDDNGLHLAVRLLAGIAQNQFFFDGNKRTAYLSFTLFWARVQREHFGRVYIRQLDDEFLKKISDLATRDITLEEMEGRLERYFGEAHSN